MTNTLKESVQFVLNSAIYKQTSRFDIDGNITYSVQMVTNKESIYKKSNKNDASCSVFE